LGAGAGWGVIAGTAAAAVTVFIGADDRGLADIAGAVGLGLLFGAPTGAVLGLALSLLPAAAVTLARSARQARVSSATVYTPVAVLLVAAQFNDGLEGQEPYAAVFVAAALFGLWRCQRSAALAVERVAARRAAPRVLPVGMLLAEPNP
jgi:hypothetical protein